MFSLDILDACAEQLRSETTIGIDHTRDEGLLRMSESINAKYGATGTEMLDQQ